LKQPPNNSKYFKGWSEDMGKRTETYEREKLYQEVWKEPVLVVAKRYGVSEVALSKACRKLAVPLPPRGYWVKVRAGRKAAPRSLLPPYESVSGIKTTRRVTRGSLAQRYPTKTSDKAPQHSRCLNPPMAPPERRGKPQM
jgi:hypothetical protein